MYQIHQKQKIPVTLGEAWDFFSDPGNLKIITPNYMSFDIVSGGDQKMFPGQIIEYVVTPIAGIKMEWVTEITHVIEKEYFVDEQRIGPYSFWHHKHFFKQVTGGVEMVDKVDYKLPFGPFGKLIHAVIVNPNWMKFFPTEKIN